MKTKSFALAVTILLMAIVVNTSLMAQSTVTKQTKKEIKTIQPKIESKIKTGDIQRTAGTVHQKDIKTIKNKENKKTKVKKTIDKENKKTEKEMIHHKMPTTKTEKTKKETK